MASRGDDAVPRTIEQYRLLRADSGTPVVDVLQVAASTWTRFLGLQFRRPLPPGHGLLIVPCSSIHTICVRFAIDVFFLSEEGIVEEVRRDVHPWRLVLPSRPAHAVLEMAAGSRDVEPGTAITIDPCGDTVPAELRFLTGQIDVSRLENEPC